jgi:ribokinase
MEDKSRNSVLTIGGGMIDTIAVIDDERIERMSMNNAGRAFLLLEEGRKTEASIISTHPGGGAINSAVAFARLGFSVATVVKLGEDSRGRAVREALQTEGISQDLIVETSAAGTGASVLISAHERNAAVFTFRGANSLLEKHDLPTGGFARDIVYITGLSDRSSELFPEIVARAAAAGAFITANPGIRQLAARGGDFQKALSKVSLLSINRDEAATLLPRLLERLAKPTKQFSPDQDGDTAQLMRRGFSASGFEMSLPHFCEALLALGPQCIVITDGSQGAYAAVRDEIVFCPALSTNVVGTAGAGDAFTSTFTAIYSNGAPPGDALRYATVNAASVVGFADTQSGLLRRSELNAGMATNVDSLHLRYWHADKNPHRARHVV